MKVETCLLIYIYIIYIYIYIYIHWHSKTQILPSLPPWIIATASISPCLSIVAQSSPSYSMLANYFEVIKTCFLLSLISIYCSLSIRFNCLWNFVSLWLWVAQHLSFFFVFVFVFMEFCWFMVVGCPGFKFFCFCYFFSLKISTFSSSSFVVKSVAKKNHEIFVIRFSFSLFLVCNFY